LGEIVLGRVRNGVRGRMDEVLHGERAREREREEGRKEGNAMREGRKRRILTIKGTMHAQHKGNNKRIRQIVRATRKLCAKVVLALRWHCAGVAQALCWR